MKKRIFLLLLVCILCLNLFGTAFAITWDNGDTKDEVNGDGLQIKIGTGEGFNDSSSDSGGSGGSGVGSGSADENSGSSYESASSDSSISRSKSSGPPSSTSKDMAPSEQETVQGDTPEATPDDSRTVPVYSDVPRHEWYYQAITYVSVNGIMAGNGGSFAPNDRLTRGMMAQILYNMEKAADTGAAAFPDVDPSDWFAAAAAWASAQGFMSGYSNGSFGPNDAITREQLAAILYRYARAKGLDVSASAEIFGFADGAMASDWAAGAVRWAVGAGILSGKTGIAGSRLDPTGTATRAEVAQILMNFAAKAAQTAS